ncbi:MAG: hypothetical protein ACO1QB_17590 [Verrucomicrobiales bacterium]
MFLYERAKQSLAEYFELVYSTAQTLNQETTMLEVITEAISGPTLPFTILLGLVLVYWLLVAVGLFHFDSDGADVGAGHHLSGDLHVDDGGSANMDADGSHHDHSSHTTIEHGNHSGPFKGILNFLNIGEVPITVVISVLALMLWVCSMLLNHYLNPQHNDTRSLALLIPNLVISLVGTSIATRPFKKLFRALNRDFDQHQPVLGRLCTISTSEANENFGQAIIEREGSPLVINVRTYGEVALKKGEQALIIKEDAINQIYTVAKLTPQNPQPEPQENQLC